MSKVRWVKFKSYSGLKISGTQTVPLPRGDLHMDRAYWLTAMLEAPKYGSVQSYDGAAMSGGPLHNIAVYPRNMKQGSLFPLLRQLEYVFTPAVDNLWRALRDDAGWYVARDGKLRDYNTGDVISGRAIRQEFSPTDGKVPRAGSSRKQAEKWIKLFHELFSDPLTFDTQREFAIDYLIRGQQAHEAKVYAHGDGDRDIRLVRAPEKDSLSSTHIPLELDLAMCVYHSHSVNAPAPARSVLVQTLKEFEAVEDLFTQQSRLFSRRLIYLLGKKRFGRWRDTADGKNRYDRTRYWAKRRGLWPAEFFASWEDGGLMPNNLPPRYK